MPDDPSDVIALRNRVSTMVRDHNAFTVAELLAFQLLGEMNLEANCESPGLETQAGREAERDPTAKGPPTPASTSTGE
jgi:hypothetical protein